MANYRISEHAKADLNRIYRRGVREYGEVLADQYYDAFFDRFEQLAKRPHLYQAVDDIREGYRRSVCGRTLSIIELMAILWKSCAFWASKMSMSGFSVRQC